MEVPGASSEAEDTVRALTAEDLKERLQYGDMLMRRERRERMEGADGG